MSHQGVNIFCCYGYFISCMPTMAGSKEAGISVVLRQCRHLHSSRSDKFSCLVQVEHSGSVIGSWNKPDWEKDNNVDVDLEVKVQCSASDPQSLANVATNPLLVSFLEVLPKDKKSKEEKTSVLGQASVDLLPILLGEYSSKMTISLHPSETTGVPPPGGDESTLQAEVDIEVSVDRPLIKPDKLAQSNVLSLRVRSLHSLPESWQPGTFPFTFTLAMPLPQATPTSDDAVPPRAVTVPQGLLKLSPDKDPTAVSACWKWPNSYGVTSKASQVSDCEMNPRSLEDETGELNSKQDVKFRSTVECDRPRVAWNIQHRTWLDSSSAHSLLSRLSVSPIWPIEIGRFSVPTTGGKGKAKEEEPSLSYLSVAYVNLSSLLYPGVTHVCGAYPLHPFNETEILEKTEHHHSSILLGSSQSSGQSTIAKKPPKRTMSSAKLQTPSGILAGGGGDGEGMTEGAESKSEAQAYVDAKTYIYLEIELQQPLIPKRPASVLAERISEYIPCRPPVPRQVGGVERAMMDYHQQTAKIADVLLQEFRELYGEQLKEGNMDESQSAINDRRHKLLFHLNSSGKYHTFKEQLKQSVVKIVREKYLNEAKVKDRDQLQSFLSQLYVFLVDEMHTGLNKVLSLEDAHPAPPSVLNSDLLKHFAFEAEEEGNYELAHRFYKERISHQDHIAEYWYDYGVFCLLASDLDQSEQCFKEAIALEQTMVPALLLYGMVCSLDEKFTEGEQFFDMATTSDPTNVVAWTMRGLYYELAGNGIYQDMCFQEATKLNRGQSAQTFITTTAKSVRSSHLPPSQAVNKAIASQSKASVASRQAGSLKQPSVASIGGRGQQAGGGTGELSMPQVLLESAKSMSSTEEEGSVKNRTSLDQQDKKAVISQALSTITSTEGGEQRTLVESKSTLNDRDSIGGLTEGEQDTTDGDGLTAATSVHDPDGPSTQPSLPPPPPPPATTNKLSSISGVSVKSNHSSSHSSTTLDEKQPVSVFLQTAAYLLDVHALKFAEMALAHELVSPKGGPSPQFHVAEARLYMHREQYDKAISCLKKAITMDYQDSNAWALLGHAYFLTEDYISAKDAYERTVNYVKPCAHLHVVYIRLAQIYLNEKQYERSKEVYLRACRKSPSAVTWRGVGVSCYHLGDLNQAEDALCEANILNNQDPIVWAYLTLVCLKTDRATEAEQALKFALKVGLNDPVLMSEISKLQGSHPHSTTRGPGATMTMMDQHQTTTAVH